MPDVGVLNLQIHSESTQAENSLRRLEGALLAIKKATGETGLNKTVNALQRLKSAVNFETIGNLHALAAALNQVKRACDFTVPNLSGLNRFRQSVERMRSSAASIGQMRNSVNDFTEGFATAEARVSGATSKVNEFGNAMDKVFSMVGNGKFEQFNRMFDAWEKMRSARSLGAGENTGVSTSVEKGWTAWKNGAIEVEGTVSDAMGNIVGYIESAGEKVQSGNETVANAFRQTGTSVSEMRMRTEMYFSSIKNRIAELNEQWIGAIQKARELGESMKKIYETPGVSDSKKKEAFAEYRTATDNVRALLEEMKAVDRQATETAQKLGISYESITASVERHTQAVYEDARQQMKAVNTQKHFEYQTRHLDYYQQNLASMSELDKKNFKEMYANDPAMTSAIEQIERMAAAQGNLNDEQSRATGAYGIDTKAIENGIAQLGEARQRITQINKDFEEAVKRMEETGGVMPRVDTSALDQAYNDVTAFVDNMSMQEASVANTAYEFEDRIRALAAAEEDMKNKMAAAVAGGAVQSEAMARYAVAIRLVRGEQEQLLTQLVELQQKQSASGRLTEAVKADFEVLGSVVKKILSPLKNLAKQFVNIARRMAIRAVIRQFTDGIREGVENMYWWSKANNTDFAPSLDHLATSLKDLTNSLGAMAAEVLTAVMPVLEQIIDKVIEGVNWLNQFFAALQGKNTWMKYERGSETTKMFDDTKKAASGASKAMKELLADWDELNIIQSESSRGGGSGSSYKWSEENTGKYTETPIGSGPVAAAGWVKNNWGWVVGAGVVGAAGLATLKGFIKNFIFKNKVERIVQDILEKNDLTGKNGEKTGMEKAQQAAEEAKETTEQAKQATEQAKDAVEEATSKVDEVIEQNKPERLAELTVEKANIERATVDTLLDKTDIKRLEAGSDTPPKPLGLDDVQQNAKRLMDATLNNNVLPNTDISRTLDLVEKALNKTIPSMNQENISYLNEGVARLIEGSKLPPAQESAQQNLRLEAVRNIGTAGQELLGSAEEIKASVNLVGNGVIADKKEMPSAETPKLNAAQTVLDTSNKLIAGAKEVSESAKLLAEGAEASAKTVNIDGVDTVKLNSGEVLDSSLANNKEYMALREKVTDALGDQWGSIGVEGAAERRLAIAESRLQDEISKSGINVKEEVKRLVKTGWDKETATKDVTDRVKIAEANKTAAVAEVENAKKNVELAHEFNEMTHNINNATMDRYVGNPVYPRNWKTIDEIAMDKIEASTSPAIETSPIEFEMELDAGQQFLPETSASATQPIVNVEPVVETTTEILPETVGQATANLAATTEQFAANLNEVVEKTTPVLGAGNNGVNLLGSGAYTGRGEIPFDIKDPVDWSKELVAYKVDGVPLIFRKSDLTGGTDWSTMDLTYVKQGNTGGFVVHPQQDLTAGEKLQSLIFRGENFLAQHGTEIMAALLIAQGVGNFVTGKYVEEKAYEEVYGDRYTSLSALAKLRVRQEGGNLEPEDAQASINRWKETVKNFLPGAFLDWLPEAAEAAYGRAHGVAVVAGQGAKPIMETAGSVFEWAYEMIDSLGGLLETPKMQYEKEQKAGTIASEYVAQDPTLTALKDDIAKLVSEGNKYGDLFDISVWSSALSMGENLQDWLYKNLAVNLGWGSDNDANVVAFKKIFDETGMSMWDILPDELKNKYIDYVFQYLGDDFKVVDKRLKEELGVPFADLFSMYRKEDMWDAFSNEGKKSFIQYYSGLYSGSEVLKGLASGGVGLEELLPIMMMFPDSTWQGALRPLSDLYGYENLEGLLYSQYGINLSDFYVPEGKSGKYWTPDQLYAGGAWNGYGAKPSNWGEYNGEETDTAKDVQDGTKAANAELEEQGDETNRLLRQLIQTLINKQFVVTPSSAWGDHNAKSEGFWANVTGSLV